MSERKVIQLSGDMALCDDGTIWKFRDRITIGDLRNKRSPWYLLDGVPQDKLSELEVFYG